MGKQYEYDVKRAEFRRSDYPRRLVTACADANARDRMATSFVVSSRIAVGSLSRRVAARGAIVPCRLRSRSRIRTLARVYPRLRRTMSERTDERTGARLDPKRACNARWAYKKARNSTEPGKRCIPLNVSADAFDAKLKEHGLFAVCQGRSFVLHEPVEKANEDRQAGLYVVDDSGAIVSHTDYTGDYTGGASVEAAGAGDGQSDMNDVDDGGALLGAAHNEPFTPRDDVRETRAARRRRESDEVGPETCVRAINFNMIRDNEQLKKYCGELEAKFENATKEIDTLSQQNRDLNVKYDNAKREIDKLRRDNEGMKTALTHVKNAVHRFG